MSQTFTFQNAPVELLDVPQLVLLTDTTQKVDSWLMDRFFPQRVSYTKKEVPVGELTTATQLAPFVTPTTAGRQIKVGESGYVKFVKAAYRKPMVTVMQSRVQNTGLRPRLRTF